MNKDVIYIEPEDDITDIISKIENAKEKIVALVPPKKAGVFRSVVNIKLISKAGASAEKNVVLVTSDPSILKLAAATKLPVAKNLQTAPVIPKEDAEVAEVEVSKEEVDEEAKDAEEEAEDETTTEEDAKEDEAGEDEEEEEPVKPKKEKKATKKFKNKFLNWIVTHKKLSIICGIGILVLLIFLIWALFIAPAVNVFVSIKTDSNNFSEAISFVKEQSQENVDEGKIYLEERKIETENEVEFKATGERNTGEKATGEVVVYTYFKEKSAVAINAGSVFTIGNLSYVSSKDASLSWDGSNMEVCGNNGQSSIVFWGCLVSGRVAVTASAPGSDYNIAASETNWSTTAPVKVYSDKAMAGGTDNIITVVQQSDVEKAKDELSGNKEAENKEKLYATITDDNLIIESTFKQTTSNATATPAVGEEVGDGVTPKLKTTTTTSVYVIDKTKLEELIKEKVDLPDDKKIFEIRNVYIDGFKELDSGFTGKLKAVYYTGPKLTESELVEKIMGKGIGDARREINDIEGVAEVKMDPSYPWVMSVPTDSNRITVTFEIKDQEGNRIEEKAEGEESGKKDNKDEKDEEDSKESKTE
ncbi:hypothetical protein IJG89_01100 [Candidatus Saccharibacteria bacterium]|nr:hypothetical protein [Candidatus Saccharibacteria bacterium]